MLTYLQKNVGRRGAVLIIFASVFFFIGLKGLLDPAPFDDRFVIYTLLLPWVRALLWMIPSLIAIYIAFKPKPKRDAAGFSTLVIPVVILFISYLGSVAAFLFGYTHYYLGWVDAIEWLLILILLLITSGWTEDEPDSTLKKKVRA